MAYDPNVYQRGMEGLSPDPFVWSTTLQKYVPAQSPFDSLSPEEQAQYLFSQTNQFGSSSSDAPVSQRITPNVPSDINTVNAQDIQQNNAPNASGNVDNQPPPYVPLERDTSDYLGQSLLGKLTNSRQKSQFENLLGTSQSQPNASRQNMAQDNSPSFMQNIFGTVPNYYEGLLGPAETQAIQKRSTQQGLLGAAISLLGGMGTRGTTAAQNIAGALGGGIQASQGAIQQGLTNYQMQQQLAQAKVAQEQAASLRADVAKVMQMPEVRNNPALIASLRADPAKTLAWINENMAISKAYEPASQVNQQTGAVTSMAEQPPIGTVVGGEKSLSGVTVTATRSKAETEINRLYTANQRLTGLPGKAAQEAIKSNLDQITGLQKQLMQESVSAFDFNGIKGAVSPDLLPQVNNLQRLSETGQITAKDLQDGLKDIQKADFEFKNKQRDNTNEVIRVAGNLFPGVSINSLSSDQLGKLQNELNRIEIANRRAGATTIQLPSESERTAGYLTTRFKNSLQQYNEVLGKNPEAAVPSLQAEIIRSVTNSNYLTNLATPEARQRMVAAELDMLSAALTLSTGAAYTKEELEAQRQSLFPQLGDKPANIRDKAVRLNKLLKEAAMVKAGRAAPSSTTEADEVLLELERRKGK